MLRDGPFGKGVGGRQLLELVFDAPDFGHRHGVFGGSSLGLALRQLRGGELSALQPTRVTSYLIAW